MSTTIKYLRKSKADFCHTNFIHPFGFYKTTGLGSHGFLKKDLIRL
jgi:hypothetical protein